MARYLLERIGQALLTIVVVVSFTFALVRLLPGGPLDYLKGQVRRNNPGMSSEEINNIVEARANVDPDQPILAAYVEYVLAIAQGDFGYSMSVGAPVREIIVEALPWTVFVVAVSLSIMFVVGIGLGALMAYREGSRFDAIISLVATVLNSVPFYVVGLVFLTILSYQLELFPTANRYSNGVEPGFTPAFLLDALHHAALPVLSLVLTMFGMWALTMRGNSIQILGEDYMRVARLRGLSERRIAFRYVARNAVLPMYTQLMITLGFMLGGTVILEKIFTYHGIGYYMERALQARDYPLMMGTFIVITVAVVIGVLIADLTYGWIDPRAASGGTNR